jgi:TPR repeat protein
MEINSPRKRLSTQSFQSVSDDSNNIIITPEENEENLKTLETILTLEEGIAAHKREERDIAWKCFEIHATLGDPLAIYWKGYYYLKGYYMTPHTPNANEAVNHFKQAAAANVPEAQYYYANALKKSKKPGLLFLDYFTKAADNDNVLAQCELGRIYYYGLNGVKKNEEKGIQYLKLAALKNNQNAINDLKKIDSNLLDKVGPIN